MKLCHLLRVFGDLSHELSNSIIEIHDFNSRIENREFNFNNENYIEVQYSMYR